MLLVCASPDLTPQLLRSTPCVSLVNSIGVQKLIRQGYATYERIRKSLACCQWRCKTQAGCPGGHDSSSGTGTCCGPTPYHFPLDVLESKFVLILRGTLRVPEPPEPCCVDEQGQRDRDHPENVEEWGGDWLVAIGREPIEHASVEKCLQPMVSAGEENVVSPDGRCLLQQLSQAERSRSRQQSSSSPRYLVSSRQRLQSLTLQSQCSKDYRVEILRQSPSRILPTRC